MVSGAQGYFEVASTKHGKFASLGGDGHDEGYGFRTFYTLQDILSLFEKFKIKRVHHLLRELVPDDCLYPVGLTVGEPPVSVQGSFQVEIEKP